MAITAAGIGQKVDKGASAVVSTAKKAVAVQKQAQQKAVNIIKPQNDTEAVFAAAMPATYTTVKVTGAAIEAGKATADAAINAGKKFINWIF